MTAAHDQVESRHYLMHYPEHPARADDPHYADYEASKWVRGLIA